MIPPFSRRLDWSRSENALAHAETTLRAVGITVLDLTESNPTRVGLADADSDQSSAAASNSTDLAAAFSRAARAPYAPDPRGQRGARQALAALHAPVNAARQSSIVSADALTDRLLLTASSSESYSFLWKLLGDPGDVVLVPEPSYPLFDYLARLEGVITVPYRLAHDGTRTGSWHLDLASVDEALAQAPGRVAALVVVSPNNPTGSVLDETDLRALDERAAVAGFALVADEVFADYIHRSRPTQVTFLAGRATAALTFSLGGLSKSCGLPQLKLGWIAVGGPEAVARTALAHLELISDTYLSVGTPVQVALPELLRLGAARRRAIATRIAQNRSHLEAVAQEDDRSALSLLQSDGGWSAILRLPAVKSDEQWALDCLVEDHVLVHPGYFFDLREATYLVLSLLAEPTIFREGVRRITARVALSIA